MDISSQSTLSRARILLPISLILFAYLIITPHIQAVVLVQQSIPLPPTIAPTIAPTTICPRVVNRTVRCSMKNSTRFICDAFLLEGWEILSPGDTSAVPSIVAQPSVSERFTSLLMKCYRHIANTSLMINVLHPKGDLHLNLGGWEKYAIPETYVLTDEEHMNTFREKVLAPCLEPNPKLEGAWIFKPAAGGRGNGIMFVDDCDSLELALSKHQHATRYPINAPENILWKRMGNEGLPTEEYIVQRKITNPLLIDGRVFSLRSTVLMANVVPLLVYYCHTEIFISAHQYNSTEVVPEMSQVSNLHMSGDLLPKSETAWGLQQLEDLYPDVPELKGDALELKVISILARIFDRLYPKMVKKYQDYALRVSHFNFLGVDLMIDEKYEVSLLEINVNPGFYRYEHCAAIPIICDLLKTTGREAVHILEEVYNKTLAGQNFEDMKSVEKFKLVIQRS